MGFEKADQFGQEFGRPGAGAKLVRPDSGQVDETAGPPVIVERLHERGKREHLRVVRRFVAHGLEERPKG